MSIAASVTAVEREGEEEEEEEKEKKQMRNGHRWVFKRIDIVSAFDTWRMIAGSIGDMLCTWDTRLGLIKRVNNKCHEIKSDSY